MSSDHYQEPEKPGNGELWQKHSLYDSEDRFIHGENTKQYSEEHPESVQSLGSFEKFANDFPDDDANPNDNPENNDDFRPKGNS